jgi:hypothetical protein
VLSLPPHKLLESDEPLNIGALEHDNKAVRDWLAGTRPLEGVEPGVFYSTPTAAGPSKRNVFSGELRGKADLFDTAADSDERSAIAEEVGRLALDQVSNERRLANWLKRRGDQ